MRSDGAHFSRYTKFESEDKMDIKKIQEGKDLVISVSGRLDTTTAPELEECIKETVEAIENLTLDLKELEYISSAGLRVLLATQKIMSKQGSMKVTGVGEVVMEIFEVTGFADILTIE